jgi:hypothetical protein
MLSLPSDTICKMAKIAPKQVVGILKDVIMKGVDANIFLKDKTVSGGRLNLYKSSELLIRMFGANVGNYNISKMYPNPVNRTLSIELTLPANPNVDLVVSNMLGQVVYQKHVEDIDLLKKTLTISTEGLAPGVYYLSILADKFKTSKSFMVAHP